MKIKNKNLAAFGSMRKKKKITDLIMPK